ncbi:MAG TPA: pseudouridylate synthase [Cytophagales bacterium]|nr:pseudouridylate synthase [Cytophagales bacterium]HAA17233.1 pseudouridylate synthase [Cytophagales bacterium]HAP63097.1 pseudouridylate synthase [Cytophagales bacterium]
MDEAPHLDILYQDDWLVAVNKPHGLLVHRTGRASDAKVFALQTLRNQLDRHVFPAHRLDRKTAGVLLFSLDSETANAVQGLFADRKTQKTYRAVVRGYTEPEGTIDYALRPEDQREEPQEAVTRYRTLDRVEVPVPFGKFSTSRYSLVEAYPETGRMHQIRKHFAHILHPIIADRPHGCNKQNRLFKEHWQMETMLLHAHQLDFLHPVTQEPVSIQAPIQNEFRRMVHEFGWERWFL